MREIYDPKVLYLITTEESEEEGEEEIERIFEDLNNPIRSTVIPRVGEVIVTHKGGTALYWKVKAVIYHPDAPEEKGDSYVTLNVEQFGQS